MNGYQVISNSLVMEKYVTNFQNDFTNVKELSNKYIVKNNEKDFFNISKEMRKLEYNQLIFPKRIRKNKTLKAIRDVSDSLSKIDAEFRAYELIDKKILSKKSSAKDQNFMKNFENTIKVRKQNLLARSTVILNSISTLESPKIDMNLNNSKVEKRIIKLNTNVNKLRKQIGNQVLEFDTKTSSQSKDKYLTKKIGKLQKRFEKLKIILDTLTNLPSEYPNLKDSGQVIKDDNYNTIIKNYNKIHKILQDINSINHATKILGQAGSEHYLLKAIEKINDDLQNKQKQFIDICKQLSDVKVPSTHIDAKSQTSF